MLPGFIPNCGFVFGPIIKTAAVFSASVGSVTQFTTTTTTNIPAGSLSVIVVGVNSSNSVTVSSVSDGTNSYTSAVTQSQNGGVGQTSLWYVANAKAVASGATITVTFSGNTGAVGQSGIIAAAVSGAMTTTPLDKTASGSAASNTVTVASGALTLPSEIIFGGNFENNSASPTYTTPSGFTNIANVNTGGNGSIAMDYQIVSGTSSVSYAPSWSTGSSIGACVATFKKG
jgi:hypothetical protein